MPRLSRTQEIARAANLEIRIRDLEAVPGRSHRPKSRFALLAAAPGNQHTLPAIPATPDAPTKLMKLGETKAFGVLDHHQRRPRLIAAHLLDRRRDENRSLRPRNPFPGALASAPCRERV